MKPGKLYRFRSIANPIKIWDFKNEGGKYREIVNTDVVMLVKFERAHGGCYNVQFLHIDKIGWILFPYKSIGKIQKILEEINA